MLQQGISTAVRSAVTVGAVPKLGLNRQMAGENASGPSRDWEPRTELGPESLVWHRSVTPTQGRSLDQGFFQRCPSLLKRR